MSGALLTPVQARVLAAAADGAPLTEVADRLGVPRPYVAARLSEIYKRLELVNFPKEQRRAEAVRIARANGAIPPAEETP